MGTNFILLGCLGGIIPDIIRLLKLREDGKYFIPDYLTTVFFWIVLILQIGLGALVVYLMDVNDKLQAVVYGYAAPQIFTSVASGIISRTGGDQGSSKGQHPNAKAKRDLRDDENFKAPKTLPKSRKRKFTDFY